MENGVQILATQRISRSRVQWHKALSGQMFPILALFYRIIVNGHLKLRWNIFLSRELALPETNTALYHVGAVFRTDWFCSQRKHLVSADGEFPSHWGQTYSVLGSSSPRCPDLTSFIYLDFTRRHPNYRWGIDFLRSHSWNNWVIGSNPVIKIVLWVH